jgi:hypothetical protein
MTDQAFPLQWPEGWPRTPYDRRKNDHAFRGRYNYQTHTGGGELQIGKARDGLMAELKSLGAKDVILSTNMPLRNDGLPYANGRLKDGDPGVAVYFELKKRKLVMARDAYHTLAGNMRSLALAVDAMRQLQRHGGDRMMERAFTGFVAIAPPDWKKPWREVFGVKPDWRGDLQSLYREKARNRHPDAGGNDSLMAELNVAYEEAQREFGA